MKRKKGLQSLMGTAGLLILIFDSKLAMEGARAGIELCIHSVIPSLFPFFVLSILLTKSLSEDNVSFLRILADFFRIPKTAASVIVPGFLGGYPVGAKCVSDLYQRNQITKKEAERLLAFCCNVGPSFLFGMVSGFFPDIKMVWMLWIIVVSSSILTAFIIPSYEMRNNTPYPSKACEETGIILPASKAMLSVCCWVILFRCIITFLDAWILWRFPQWLRVLSVGIMELTNGCCELLMVTDIEMRFIICACFLSFGGICVLLQVVSVANGLPAGYYLKGKAIQTLFSFLLSYTATRVHCGVLIVAIPLLIKILRKTEKRYSIQQTIPV